MGLTDSLLYGRGGWGGGEGREEGGGGGIQVKVGLLFSQTSHQPVSGADQFLPNIHAHARRPS